MMWRMRMVAERETDVNEAATTGVGEAFQKCLPSVMMQFGVYNTIEFPFVAFLVNFRRIARLQKLTLQNNPEKKPINSSPGGTSKGCYPSYRTMGRDCEGWLMKRIPFCKSDCCRIWWTAAQTRSKPLSMIR